MPEYVSGQPILLDEAVVQHTSSVPYYRQLETYIETKIQSEDWRPGQLLPSEQEICAKLNVSRTVVRQAMSNLKGKGLLDKKTGRRSSIGQPRYNARIMQDTGHFGRSVIGRSQKRASNITVSRHRPEAAESLGAELCDGTPSATYPFIVGRIGRSSLADSVYLMLLESIVSGTLGQGNELVATAIAERLGVSRTPVVEAIQKLIYDGLVEQSTNRTPRIANFTRQDIIELYEMRRLLEGQAACQAATRVSEFQLNELQMLLSRLMIAQDSPDWRERAMSFDILFHKVIGESCGNRRLQRDIERYRLLVRGFCRIAGTIEVLRIVCQEHRVILDAIGCKDESGAKDAMARHIEARLTNFLRHLDEIKS